MLVYEQIFRLQVSVDEVQGVKVLKGEYYLSCIKSGMVFTKKRESGQSDNGVLYEPEFSLDFFESKGGRLCVACTVYTVCVRIFRML